MPDVSTRVQTPIPADEPLLPPPTALRGRFTLGLAETFFPPRCWATGRVIRWTDGGLCAETRQQIERGMRQGYCRYCGLTTGPFSDDRPLPCGRCAQRKPGVDAMVRVGLFAPPLAGLISQLKFGKHFGIGQLLGWYLACAAQLAMVRRQEVPDVLVPLPLHWTRQWGRGFNQAREIATAAGGHLRIPVMEALARPRRTRPQAMLESAAQRQRNLRRAFIGFADERLGGRRVLLVDDVSTTGSTLNAAAAALRRLPPRARPASIHGAVVCVTDHAISSDADTDTG